MPFSVHRNDRSEEMDRKLQQPGFEFSVMCIFQIIKLLNAELSFPEREVRISFNECL